MIDVIDRQLIHLLQQGLPLVSRPYAVIGKQLQLSEDETLSRLALLKKQGVIKRLGVIVNHRQLGYKANAMVVFDISDSLVNQVGEHISQFNFINLCYQRPRQGELWPYNLYCMIHGKNRDKVLQQLNHLIESCGLGQCQHEVLFSKQCFKQRGALYPLLSVQKKT
ncbi:MAG: AsnC family transcriptional regulator [Methylococcales bacterium]|nr:AsnC family transcriptional regulator [Methylococcales bacterium]